MKRVFQGFSLIEILVCISILAILAVSSIGLTSILAKSRADEALARLRTLCGFAKAEAVMRGEPVTLCGSVTGSTCTASWANASVLIFIDRNQNGSYDNDIDTMLRNESLKHRIVWRGGANSSYMRAYPGGYLSPWGRFTYCPPTTDTHKGRQLVLNRLGRSYEPAALDPAACAGQI
jgi:prepilin-type N-terminal cleavage/methylation domain-containing protein